MAVGVNQIYIDFNNVDNMHYYCVEKLTTEKFFDQESTYMRIALYETILFRCEWPLTNGFGYTRRQIKREGAKEEAAAKNKLEMIIAYDFIRNIKFCLNLNFF